MARPRANNYDDKRRAILDRSAALFAEFGYDRASMNKIASACGVSKANLYHYYKDKDELLFDVIRVHLEDLLQVVEAADRPDLAPDIRLGELVAALLEAYRDADARHSVQISSLRFLSEDRQTILKSTERDIVMFFSNAVADVAPHLKGTTMLKPVTMSLFGMVNWHYLWFRGSGPFTREDYAKLVTHLIVDGTRELIPDATAIPKRTTIKRKSAG